MNSTSPRQPPSRPPGRVLGKPVPVRTISPAVAIRPSFPASPSESSVSIASQSSFALENGGGLSNGRYQTGQSTPMAGTESPNQMICPICGEDMVTLLQLNRHLDDTHREVEEIEKDDIQSWFRKRMMKAKQFQPVALLNQKLKGLEVFESNDNFTPLHTPAPTIASSQNANYNSYAPTPKELDPDEVVTKTHWQRSTGRDICTDPMCGKPLGTTNGSVNCRKCGRLFCEEHTLYQIKLSRAALHEPVRGIWCRVCETCYMSREGYLDHEGFIRDNTQEFFKKRRKVVDRQHLEVIRLEKRLTKLTQLLGDLAAQESATSSLLWPVNGIRNQRKLLEQSVVPWEDDASTLYCPFCKQTFTNFSLRKHHCRLCGRIVCGDPRTGCSTEVGLNVSTTNTAGEKASNNMSLDVRICKECHITVFSKKDFAAELTTKPPDLRSYETLVQFEKGIIAMLPRFQRMLVTLQDPNKPPTSQQIMDASKTRKRLLDAFTQYDRAAKRIASLPTDSPTQLQLQKSIQRLAVDFLHTKMLPLKTLPKILKHSNPTSSSSSSVSRLTPNTNNHHHPSNTNHRSLSQLSQQQDDGTSSLASSVESEEKALREQLAVLEEQKFLVEQMRDGAKNGRRFDEVGALMQSLADLDKEIGRVQGDLNDFEKRNASI